MGMWCCSTSEEWIVTVLLQTVWLQPLLKGHVKLNVCPGCGTSRLPFNFQASNSYTLGLLYSRLNINKQKKIK